MPDAEGPTGPAAPATGPVSADRAACFQLQVPQSRPAKALALVDHLKPLPDAQAKAQVFRNQMQLVAQGLAQATVWGDGLRPESVAYWLDFASHGAKQAFPTLPCWEGCADCCGAAPFRVTEAEWARTAEVLDAMPAEERGPMLQRALAEFGPHQASLDALEGMWTRGERGMLPTEAMRPCPLLNGPPEGRLGCSVYEGRPAMCRAYGHAAAANADGHVRPLICGERGPGWLREQVGEGVQDLPWPRWEPMWEAVVRLSGGPGMARIAPLAWWLLRDLQAGRWPEAGGQAST